MPVTLGGLARLRRCTAPDDLPVKLFDLSAEGHELLGTVPREQLVTLAEAIDRQGK